MQPFRQVEHARQHGGEAAFRVIPQVFCPDGQSFCRFRRNVSGGLLVWIFFVYFALMKQFLLTLLCLVALSAYGQKGDYSKMSHLVRRLAVQNSQPTRSLPSLRGGRPRQVCAFVKINADGDRVLRSYGCSKLARVGNVYIASVPVHRIAPLSLDRRVVRIEAGQGKRLAMDSTALHINALPAYRGQNLPRAYTGKGVVVGVQDIGFDLTHPNFYDSTATDYRIRQFWDQLSTDTAGSAMYVGAEYKGREALLAYAHSRDGLDQTHGTHTLGIAAGSGYNSPYRGMAWESDICIVSNASGEDAPYINKEDIGKYTYATDALGFKYIFDYAQQAGKPCVVSFSEGSDQDFRGDDVLYYELIDQLVGPGRILVVSAGNDGMRRNYFRKPAGQASAGSFVTADGNSVHFLVKARRPVTVSLKVYGAQPVTIPLASATITAAPDSVYVDTLAIGSGQYVVDASAYPSCYDAGETVYEVYLQGPQGMGKEVPLSVEITGSEADAELYSLTGNLVTNALDSRLCAGESYAGILSPASAPQVICVGASSYRTQFTNYKGDVQVYNQGTGGARAPYSSVGPTFDGRVKPDVLAPGTNIVSSYSSYYLEHHPDARDINSDVAHFDFNARTYAWNSNAGTSMAAPVVAGAIALWLEANPRLSPDDVRGILSRTCTRADEDGTYPNNLEGYGQIDVYRGLLDILQLNHINGLSTVQPVSVQVVPHGDGRVSIRFDARQERSFGVRVYAASGALMLSKSFPAGSERYELDLSALGHGVFAVQVNGGTKATTGSTLVRM